MITKGVRQTIRAGESFGRLLKRGDIVLLKGEPGAGKTHFVKGVARFFDIPENEVQSPTFSLVHEYTGKEVIYHLDCYRLRHPEEASAFGLEEYLYGNGITLIEWPEIIASLLPEDCWTVEISHINEEKRQVSVHQNS